MCEREWVKERERERERGDNSQFLRHDLSEDTAACCDYWGAATRGHTGREKVGREGDEGGTRKRQGQSDVEELLCVAVSQATILKS